MSTITAHVNVKSTGTFVGGYRDADGYFHSEPQQPLATYDGWALGTSDIVNWGKGVADEKFSEGGWTINGNRIEPVDADASRPVETLEFYQGSQQVDLSQYAYLLEDQDVEDEDVEDEENEDEDQDFGEQTLDAQGFAPIGQVIQEAAEALVDDIVANVPRSESDLRERFRRHGLLV